MRFLLDTCVISELIRKQPNRKVASWIAAQDELQLFLSVITLGKIEKGIGKLPDGRKRQALRQWLAIDLSQRFAGRVLSIDAETALRGVRSPPKQRRTATRSPCWTGSWLPPHCCTDSPSLRAIQAMLSERQFPR